MTIHLPSSPIPPRASASRVNYVADVATRHQRYTADVDPQQYVVPSSHTRRYRDNNRWLRLSLVSIALMLTSYWIGNAWVRPWVTDKIDHWNTGKARISYFHLDVGHNGKSDFVTYYLHGQVIVIEFPGGDSTEAQTYSQQIASYSDNIPRVITLHVEYVNPHGKSGKPDLMVEIGEYQGIALVLYNTGDKFQVVQEEVNL